MEYYPRLSKYQKVKNNNNGYQYETLLCMAGKAVSQSTITVILLSFSLAFASSQLNFY